MDFREDFLQLVWKYQYFEKRDLQTTNGLRLQVLNPGFHNQAEGPDFRDASLEIDGIVFHGHVEVHRLASEWKQHEHEANPAYNSVILHIVWKNDRPVYRNDHTAMPTLELDGKVFLEVWRRYEQLLDFRSELPCAHALSQVPEIIRFSALEKALVERLHSKSESVLNLLELTQGDWEETAYRWLFVSFGFRVNSQPMGELASQIPYKILQKHRTSLPTLEAMLFGLAGLLPEESSEPYVGHLIREYQFYQKKYGWEQKLLRQHWNFMGVRPSAFPTIRIAQLASILSQAPSLLQSILEDSRDFQSFKKVLQIPTSDYWKYHYSFGKASERMTSKGVSGPSLNLLIINFAMPLWYAYGHYFQNPDWKERCFDLLQGIASEKNFITQKFEKCSWTPQNAFDSQGMIGLYRGYCEPKRCLSCKVAQSLIRSESK